MRRVPKATSAADAPLLGPTSRRVARGNAQRATNERPSRTASDERTPERPTSLFARTRRDISRGFSDRAELRPPRRSGLRRLRRVRETPPRSLGPRRRRRAHERTSLSNRAGSPRTERSASDRQSSVSKTRGRYFSNPPRLRIAEGDTSVDPRGVPEAKQTHFRKLTRYEKSEGGTFGTPEGSQKHLPGTFGTPEGFQKPKPDTFCNPRGCKKYLPRTSRTPDSLGKTDADVWVSSGSSGPVRYP
jgi:hypothetical protein